MNGYFQFYFWLILIVIIVDSFQKAPFNWISSRRTLDRIADQSNFRVKDPINHNSVFQSFNFTKPRYSSFSVYYLSKMLCSIVDEPYKTEAKALVRRGMSYKEFVEVTKLIIKTGSSEEIRDRIVTLLTRIIPFPVFALYRFFSWVRLRAVAELSAFCMRTGLFHWLVGPVTKFNVIISERDNKVWNSGVRITKCLYLEEVSCKSACIHLCKLPTQSLFNNHFNLPLYMKPNFTDLSCELSFGLPPPIDDPVFQEQCFQNCSLNFQFKTLSKIIEKNSTLINDDKGVNV